MEGQIFAATSRVPSCRVRRRLQSPWPRGMACVIGGWGGGEETDVSSTACPGLLFGRWKRLDGETMMMMSPGHCAPLPWHRPGGRRERTSHSSPGTQPQAAGAPAVFALPHTLARSHYSRSLRISLPASSLHLHHQPPLQHPLYQHSRPPPPPSPSFAHIRINHLTRISDRQKSTSITSPRIPSAHPRRFLHRPPSHSSLSQPRDRPQRHSHFSSTPHHSHGRSTIRPNE